MCALQLDINFAGCGELPFGFPSSRIWTESRYGISEWRTGTSIPKIVWAMMGGDRSSLTDQLVEAQVKTHESQTLRKIRNSSWKKMKRTKTNQVLRWLMIEVDLPVSLLESKRSAMRAVLKLKSGIGPANSGQLWSVVVVAGLPVNLLTPNLRLTRATHFEKSGMTPVIRC